MTCSVATAGSGVRANDPGGRHNGTNTRLAVFVGSADRFTPVAMEVFPSRAHRGLEEILRKFGSQHSQAVDAAGLGIAGPRLPWVVDRAAVADALRVGPRARR